MKLFKKQVKVTASSLQLNNAILSLAYKTGVVVDLPHSSDEIHEAYAKIIKALKEIENSIKNDII